MRGWVLIAVEMVLMALGIHAQTIPLNVIRGPTQPALTWDHSPDPSVVGYYIAYGVLGGPTNRLEVGYTNVAPLNDLEIDRTNFIYVTAANSEGQESDPSDLLWYYPTSKFVPGVQAPIIKPLPAITVRENTSSNITVSLTRSPPKSKKIDKNWKYFIKSVDKYS
jgi:hypothetical protein